MKSYPLMIPGAEPEGESLTVTAPFNGSPIATITTGRRGAVARALESAERLFRNREQWLSAARRIATGHERRS